MIDGKAGSTEGEVMAMGEHDQDHDLGHDQGRRDRLAIAVWHSPVCPVIGLRGELCTTTAADFARAVDGLLADWPAAVVVDLSRLAFCDLEGVGALIGADRRARELGGRLVLAGVQDQCARLLRRTGLDHIFPILPGRPPVAEMAGAAT
ncbi:STAS domain-containing protein [Nonomuraea sp. CA-141351]|uniref:STAS domain-containing protein n=1 Tax=Nonomuraea sp. CA-141351 TaxID=3239996 RepID=UPI003D93FD76